HGADVDWSSANDETWTRVVHPRRLDANAGDVHAIGGVQVFDVQARRGRHDPAMTAAHGGVRDAQVSVLAASDDERLTELQLVLTRCRGRPSPETPRVGTTRTKNTTRAFVVTVLGRIEPKARLVGMRGSHGLLLARSVWA